MKKLRGCSFSINMANFEAFCRTKKLISNLFFLKSEKYILEVHMTYFKYILQLSIRNKSYILQVPISNTYFKYILQIGKNLES